MLKLWQWQLQGSKHYKNWQIVVGHVGLQLHLLSQFGLDRRTQRILLTQRERLKEDGKQAVLEYLRNILIIDNESVTTHTSNGEETQQMLDMLLDSTRYTSTERVMISLDAS